jgi:hypothetical protein
MALGSHTLFGFSTLDFSGAVFSWSYTRINPWAARSVSAAGSKQVTVRIHMDWS